MNYNTNYQNLQPNTGNSIENVMGKVAPMALNFIPGIGQIASLGMMAGQQLSNLIPKDENGIYKNSAQAGLSSFLNPLQNYDEAFGEMKSGSFFKGLGMMLPGIGGIITNEDKKDDIEDLSKKNHVQKEIGAFNPLAGKYSGESSGMKSTYINYKPQLLGVGK